VACVPDNWRIWCRKLEGFDIFALILARSSSDVEQIFKISMTLRLNLLQGVSIVCLHILVRLWLMRPEPIPVYLLTYDILVFEIDLTYRISFIFLVVVIVMVV
jgi:hypothetical protein